MKNFIIVSFEDAGIWITTAKKSKDYVHDSFTVGNWVNREEHEKAKETILRFDDKDVCDKLLRFEPISNMLHVLCGCRPVPTFKNTLRHRIKALDEIAKNCYYKIDNTYYTVDRENNKRLILDAVQGKKWVSNANIQKGLVTSSSYGITFSGHITWSTLYQRYYFDNNEKYKRIIDKFCEWVEISSYEIIKKKFTLIDFILYLSEEKGIKDEMIQFFKKEQMMTFIHIINKDTKNTNPFNYSTPSCNNYNFARRIVNTDLRSKVILSGSFIFQIDDDKIYESLINGGRFATYLEGGLAKIERFCDNIDGEFLYYYDYQKLTNL